MLAPTAAIIIDAQHRWGQGLGRAQRAGPQESRPARGGQAQD
jgi:hypothetical protein